MKLLYIPKEKHLISQLWGTYSKAQGGAWSPLSPPLCTPLGWGGAQSILKWKIAESIPYSGIFEVIIDLNDLKYSWMRNIFAGVYKVKRVWITSPPFFSIFFPLLLNKWRIQLYTSLHFCSLKANFATKFRYQGTKFCKFFYTLPDLQ